MNGHPNPEEANPVAPDLNSARNWSLGVTIAGATMATALSYVFITQFFIDVAGMELWLAFAFGGFLEVCLVGAGLQARHRILAGADAGVLITLTWIFSGISAGLSASHEIVHRSADGTPVLDLSSGSPLTMIVRAIAPLVAAVMWHLLLIGEKHMVSGRPRGYRKHARLMHTYMLAREHHRDLDAMDAEAEVVEAARAAMNQARAEVFRKVPVSSYRLVLEERIDAMAADFEGSARVDRMSEVRKPVKVHRPLPRTEGGARRLRAVPAASGSTRVSASAPAMDSGIPNQEPAPAKQDLDTEARNLTIVELDRVGDLTQKEIAEQFGISDRQVRNIVKSRSPQVD